MSDLDNSVRQARRLRLEASLRTLSDWARNRADGKHDVETTLSLLERKATGVREQVLSAGHRAAAVWEQHNKKAHEHNLQDG